MAWPGPAPRPLVKILKQIALVHYDPKAFDFGKAKAFPMRVQHFFTAIHRAEADLDWTPSFDLVSGLKDSFDQDYLATGQVEKVIDFSLDEQILKAVSPAPPLS
jgi:hypothetical protein